jgi:NADP-dependent 3-hydroxy acid dehydrogenase YdfG
VDRPLEGRVAIVTGASSGIGAAIAQKLAKCGALVAMAARREDKLEELKKSIQGDGGVAIAVRCDITNREQVS